MPEEAPVVEENPVMNKEQFAQLIAGILESYGVKIDVLALLICIQEEDKALMAAVAGVQTIEEAIAEWSTDKKAAVGDMFGGLLIEYVAYSTAVQALPTCEAIANTALPEVHANDLEKLLAPSTMTDIFGVYNDDLQINGYSIMYMVQEAMAAFHQGHFEQFGEKLGQIMHLVSVPKANEPQHVAVQEAEAPTDMSNVAEMLQGFFQGVGIVDMNFMDVLVCIYEADQSALELYADLQIWQEAWADKSLFEGLFAVVFLVAFGQSIKQQVVPACSQAFEKYDWTPLDQVVNTIEDPVNHLNVIGNDLVLNGLPITEAIEVAYQDYTTEQWFAFGENIGQALAAATRAEAYNYIM